MKDIINKIKKLLAMSEENGASENESMMASEKALELLKQHNLSLSDIKDEDQEPIEKETQVVDQNVWQRWIRHKTAELYFCKFYTTTEYNSETYKKETIAHFVGRESNRIVATEMCNYFIRTVKRLAEQEFKKVNLSPLAKRRAKHAFTLGCANRLSKRLKEKYLSIVPEYQPISNPDGLPMLYKSEQKALTDWLKTQGVVLTSTKSRMSIRDRMAFANGQSKGNGIGIDTQVNGKTKARLLT
jgi:hypothetical protein